MFTMMVLTTRPLHPCECAACQQETDHPQRLLHQQINLFLSRLDEQQRRWFAAVEAHDEDTIARGKRELDATLEGRPTEQIRLKGGGRPATEKKSRP